MAVKELQNADYRIRKFIGILGLALPILLPITAGHFLSSISHYYYSTLSSLVFIIILSAFALFLISYKGYKRDLDSERISDDFLTNIGGLAALVVVFVPTKCGGSASSIIDAVCVSCQLPLFGHENATLNTIHLIAAGLFIFCMGWMSKYKFTRGQKTLHNRIYRLCGTIVFASIGCILVCIILEQLNINFLINNYYVYIFETIAVIAFGISWLIKGEAIENLMELKDKMMG